jgi:hypothetical protein
LGSLESLEQSFHGFMEAALQQNPEISFAKVEESIVCKNHPDSELLKMANLSPKIEKTRV